jgi:hypothetical protein
MNNVEGFGMYSTYLYRPHSGLVQKKKKGERKVVAS